MERNYIGVDLHKASFQACAVDATGARLWERRFPRTPEGIAAFGALEVRGARIAVEAMGPTWKFVDAVQALEAEMCVVDPRKTKLKAGFAAKTDNWMPRRLADALGATVSWRSTFRRPRFVICGSAVGVGTTWCGSGRNWCRDPRAPVAPGCWRAARHVSV